MATLQIRRSSRSRRRSIRARIYRILTFDDSRAGGNSGWYRSLSLSTGAHVLLIIALALIVLQTQQTLPPIALVSDPIEEPSAFLLVPETTTPTLVVPLTPPVSSPEMTALTSIQTPPLKPITQPIVESAPASSQPSPQISSGEMNAVAVSIQKKVSNAGGKQGEVQFALAWKNTNDVDIHVITPSRDRISHLRRRSLDGGLLDVDMNVKGESRQPVENVRWIKNAPTGRYTILVHLFRIHENNLSSRHSRSSAFQLLAQLGPETEIHDAVVSRRQQLAVYRFIYVPQSTKPSQKSAIINTLKDLQEHEELEAQPMLDSAREIKAQRIRDQRLNQLIMRYPHTDVAIEAMQLLGGDMTK